MKFMNLKRRNEHAIRTIRTRKYESRMIRLERRVTIDKTRFQIQQKKALIKTRQSVNGMGTSHATCVFYNKK